MEYSWKLSDDELFDPEGLPRNGRCAPGREGDILDLAANVGIINTSFRLH